MKLTDKIKQYMAVNKIQSLAEFARSANLPYMTVSHLFEKDNNNTRIETLIKLKNTMGISLDELVDENIDIDFHQIKNADYIDGTVKVDDNTVISIGRGGKRSIYSIADQDAMLVDNFLERIAKKKD